MDTRESVSDADMARWEAGILAALDNAALNEDAVARRYGTTLEEVQRVCGSRGHNWEIYDHYIDTLLCTSFEACCICGALRDDDEPFVSECAP